MNEKNTTLIDVLDTCKSKQKLNYKECLVLLNIINYEYVDSGNFRKTMVGEIPFNYSAIQTSPNILQSAYDIWKNDHEIDFSLNILKKIDTTPKTKIEIDVKIDTLSDILLLLEKYECKPDIEYNIDLHLLHNIKDELVLINNMIGMEKMKKSILDQLLYFIQNLHQGKTSEFKHTVITGPPGTGKTEIAKIIGAMYSKIGILKKNFLKRSRAQI